MLVIRDEQMKAMQEYMLAKFAGRMFLHLRENLPEETSDISDEKLRDLIQMGIEKAESYSIVEHEDIQGFLEFMITKGPNFHEDDDHPEIQKILSSAEMDGEEKIDEIDYYYERLEEKSQIALNLRESFPEETSDVSDEELSDLVQTGMDKAKSYNITEDESVQRFLEYMVARGTNFHEDDAHPEIQQILSSTEMDGEEKIDEIDYYYERLEEELSEARGE
jgi:hypothetical protein